MYIELQQNFELLTTIVEGTNHMPQSPHQPTRQVRDTSPTPTLMHSKYAGPSVMTGPTQTPPPRAGMEEGWKRKREKVGVPTRADIARGGDECQRLHWRGRPAGKGGSNKGNSDPLLLRYLYSRMRGRMPFVLS
jgi:hypothetical protein